VLELALAEATRWVGQLEGPQEVVCLLEVGADGVDFVDQVLDADDAVFAEVVLDDLVVGQGDALLVDLAVAALVDELAHGLEVGVAPGDVGVDDGQHLLRGLGEAHEDAVVDLQETQELQDLAGLRRDLVDTAESLSRVLLYSSSGIASLPLDTDDKGQLGLLRDVEGALLPAQASKTDLLTLGIAVLLDVLLGTLEDDGALLLVGLQSEQSAVGSSN